MPRDLVRDVIVLNNSPNDDLSATMNPWSGGDDRVTVIGSSRNLGIGNNRFFAATLARTRAVLTQDDDMLLSEATVRELHNRWAAEPDRVHGVQCRGPVPVEAGSVPLGKSDIPTPLGTDKYRYFWNDWRATPGVTSEQMAWRSSRSRTG